MAAQEQTKKNLGEIFGIFECQLLQNLSNQALNCLDSSRPNGRISQNLKTGFRDLFLPENNFKTCSIVNFLKMHPDFGGLETNQRHEPQTRFCFICRSGCSYLVSKTIFMLY